MRSHVCAPPPIDVQRWLLAGTPADDVPVRGGDPRCATCGQFLRRGTKAEIAAFWRDHQDALIALDPPRPPWVPPVEA